MGTAKRERQKQGRQARMEAAQIARQRSKRRKTIRNFGIVLALIVVGVFVLSRSSGTKKPAVAKPTFGYGTGPCPAADGSSPQTLTFTAAPQKCIDENKTYTATFETSEGNVTVALDPKTTPGTVNNFVVLARYHYYDGTTIFRTAPSIGILQGGAPHTNSSSDPGPGYSLNDEGFDFNALPKDPSTGQVTGGPYKYTAGDLVMARTPTPNGASAQFFFGADQNVANLDAQGVYVKFGKTTAGLDVLAKILALHDATKNGPSRTVTLTKVTITES